jgi:hypothetical protein
LTGAERDATIALAEPATIGTGETLEVVLTA